MASARATVLDLLEAVTRVSRSEPAVISWWMMPRARLEITGTSRAAHRADFQIVVESLPGQRLDLARIQTALSELLPGRGVEVRDHQGDSEPKQLVRLFTPNRRGPSTTAAPERARDRA
jgi:hypothetical protein